MVQLGSARAEVFDFMHRASYTAIRVSKNVLGTDTDVTPSYALGALASDLMALVRRRCSAARPTRCALLRVRDRGWLPFDSVGRCEPDVLTAVFFSRWQLEA